SELLRDNCDEFIYYDDLAREKAKKQQSRKKRSSASSAAPAKAGADAADRESGDKKAEALDLVMETIEALFAERGAEEKIWGSMVKQALKRRQPGFNESYYGFRSFGKLLDEAHARKLLELEPDEKSGGVIIRSYNPDY
ncbi:MAG: OST-HTH/LOTUS domain-containing protein, partial [Burkholderiales bacterium]|nr:OST-HTH/LOTUS domain-containing protein [Burkholderiales bacterium]